MTEDEYGALVMLDGKAVRKMRYRYEYDGGIAEIDIFQNELRGLVVVDFEFNSKEEKNNFLMPDFCLAEVTQEEFIAGGMLCGKKYDDIVEYLKKFNYKKLFD